MITTADPTPVATRVHRRLVGAQPTPGGRTEDEQQAGAQHGRGLPEVERSRAA